MNRIVPAIVLVLLVRLAGPAAAGDLGARDVTVLIRTAVAHGTMVGAGVVIGGGDGLTILTAAHVLLAGVLPEVRFPDGTRVDVRSVEAIPGHDLALIRTAAPPSPVRIPAAGSPAVGEPLAIWGHPRGAPFMLSKAIVIDIDPSTPVPAAQFLIACPTCDVGDSGGGVFDAQGTLIGIVVRVVVDAAGNHYGVWFAEPVAPATAALARG